MALLAVDRGNLNEMAHFRMPSRHWSGTSISTNALGVQGDLLSFDATGNAKYFRVTPLWDE